MAKPGGLGKGLDALFMESDSPESLENNENKGLVLTVRISDIEPDKNQPRTDFDNEALTSLAESISCHGVLQPLIVRHLESDANEGETAKILSGKYRIISGERRWRAAKMAGLREVPVIVKELSDSDVAAVMLVENLQREDLNPVEEARGLYRLIDEFGLTQESAASVVGISRPAVANSLRLLSLPKETLELLKNGDISAGHARALLSLSDGAKINAAAKIVMQKDLSVRETEKLVRSMAVLSDKPVITENKSTKAYLDSLEEKITSKMGRKAKIIVNKKDKKAGKLELEYYNNEDFENLLKLLCGSEIFNDQ